MTNYKWGQMSNFHPLYKGDVYPDWGTKDLPTEAPEDICMHTNCQGCKNGTCSGIHMISCPCEKCTITCSTS